MGKGAAGVCGGRGSDSLPAGHLLTQRRCAVAAADAQNRRTAVGAAGAAVPGCAGVHCRAVGIADALKGAV